jgi:hypothetical protein
MIIHDVNMGEMTQVDMINYVRMVAAFRRSCGDLVFPQHLLLGDG